MKTIDVKSMSVEELKELKQEITIELGERVESKNVILEGVCKGSSKYHFSKTKHWIKKVRKIDTSKTNGYAFEGDFLKTDAENLIKDTDFIVEKTCGNIYFYRGNNKEDCVEGSRDNFVSFVLEADKFMQKRI
ncbi:MULTISPECIES: hypothetical protein [Pontibacillus]|uniref:Uncharacterized protein n=1 Tax=Pontibacillus chungwhensis TaxID=265426 RepID=A0ABY8V2Z0_9BACI|nr:MULTISPECIES: hypothetical protein [Pontibacillus]MCD5326164.1 hypothetical protein [Pontibacillus sp. HN14]WIG00321.1 hypothetical protein QNI29_20960 [Pontibacillus chungwhensis]